MNNVMNHAPESAVILLVDDNEDGLYAGRKVLEHAGFKVLTARDGEEALARASEGRPDIILLDVMMPKVDGLEVSRRLKKSSTLRYVPVILLSARDRLDDIIEGLEAGADGYITKPFKPDELVARTKAALRTRHIYEELRDVKAQHERLMGEVSKDFHPSNIIGQSPAIKELFNLLSKVAPTNSPVLISGPSGTGKELVAKAIHFESKRKAAPFVAKNCAAFSEQLLESQLFGHVKGAFTGAIKDQKGLFEAAHGGTLFLDELGEMPLHLQAKLLRALQEGKIMPVGTTDEKVVDVRVLAATNKDLRSMVEAGTFREDLFYRLNVIHMEVPPLKDRKEDIPVLVEHFLESAHEKRGIQKKKITQNVLEHFMAYDWRGNIRELQNEIERMLILSGEDIELDLDLVSSHILTAKSGAQNVLTRPTDRESGISGATAYLPIDIAQSMKDAVQRLEKQLIAEALNRHNGNKSTASKELGISRSSLISKVSEYGIE